MPLNVGEVEAVLSARDTMSPALVTAAANVRDLANQLGNLGATSIPAFNRLNEQLNEATVRFLALNGTATTSSVVMTQYQAATYAAAQGLNQVGAASSGAAAGLVEVDTAAKTAGQSMMAVEGIAQRLIERMVIMYAVRGTFEFVKDLFTSSEALVNLNKQSDISLGKLQELQYGAEQVGVPFQKVGTAIDTLDKNLSKTSLTVNDALSNIGLSIDRVTAMSPDQRFTAIAEAIGKLPDQLQRTAAEVALFGTDAIDPLIKDFASLSEAARKSVGIVGDDTVNALANTAKMYQSFWAEVKPVMMEMIDKGQQAVAAIAAPFYGGDTAPLNRLLQAAYYRGGPGIIDALMNPAQPPKADIHQPPTGAQGLRGEAYVAQKEQEAITTPLTQDQENQLSRLRAINDLNAQSAAAIGLTTAQWKEYQKSIKDWDADAKQATSELQKQIDLQERINVTGSMWQETLNRIDGATVDYAKSLILGGETAKDVGDYLGLLPPQLKAIEKSMQEDEKAIRDANKEWEQLQKFVEKIEGSTFGISEYSTRTIQHRQSGDLISSERQFQDDAKALTEMQRLNQDYNVAVQKGSATAADFQIAEVQRWASAQKLLYLDAEEWVRTAYWDKIDLVAHQRITDILNSYDPMWKAWKGMNEDMRQEWADTWVKAFDGTGTFADAITAPFADIGKSFEKMLAGMLADWEQQLLAPMLGSLKNTISSMFGMPTSTSSGTTGGHGLFGAFAPQLEMSMVPGRGAYIPSGLGPYNQTGAVTQGSSYYFPPGGGEPTESTNLSSTATSGYMMPITGGTGGTRSYAPGAGGKAGMALGIAGGAAMGAQADTSQGLNHAMLTGLGMDSAGGIATTIAAGVATFGISVGVQAAVAGLKYLFRDQMPEDIARDAGQKFGQVWSDGLTKIVTDRAKGFHDEVAGELASLPDIIKEHPIDLTNIDMYEGKVHDLFSMIETGKMTVAQVGGEEEQVFQQVADAATDAYGRASDKLLELIDLNERFGISSKAVTAYLQTQADTVDTGFADRVANEQVQIYAQYADIQGRIDAARAQMADPDAMQKVSASQDNYNKVLEDYNQAVAKGNSSTSELAVLWDKVVKAQQAILDPQKDLNDALALQATLASADASSLHDLTVEALIAFNAQLAAGKSFPDALAAVKPQVDILAKAYKDLGLEIDNTAFKGIAIESAIMGGPGGTGQAISGLQSMMTAANNIPGLVTADDFAAMQRDIGRVYTQTQAVTATNKGDTINALLPFQQLLHQAQDYVNSTAGKAAGATLDPKLQEMIDQSKELGIWTEEMKSDGDKTRQSIQDLINENKVLEAALGGMPEALVAAWNAHASAPALPPLGGGVGPTIGVGPGELPMADGGFGTVTSATRFLAGEAGPEQYVFSGANRTIDDVLKPKYPIPNDFSYRNPTPILLPPPLPAPGSIRTGGGGIDETGGGRSATIPSPAPHQVFITANMTIPKGDVEDGVKLVHTFMEEMRSDQNGLYTYIDTYVKTAVQRTNSQQGAR